MNMEYRENLAERLIFFRKKYNLMQKDVAEYLNITPQAYSLLEKSNRSPSYENLIALSNYYGTSIDYLTGRSDEPRHADFVIFAEASLLNEAEAFINVGINAEVGSRDELSGGVGRMIKNFYNIHAEKYTAPLARLRLVFATRELANWHLNPKTIKVRLVTPEWLRKASLLNPMAYLQERGLLSHEVADIQSKKVGEANWLQVLLDELDKLEENYMPIE